MLRRTASRISQLEWVIILTCCLLTVVLSGDGPEDFEGCMEVNKDLDIPMKCDDEIIEVMYAHFRRATNDRQETHSNGTCKYMVPENTDCLDLERTRNLVIDNMRLQCNAADHCIFTLPYYYIAQCNDTYSFIVNVQVKYACWPRRSNGTLVIPRYPMDEPIQRGEALSRIMLQSWDYPNGHSQLQEVVCHVDVEDKYDTTIYVLDLTNVLEFQIDPDCPYKLTFVNVDDFCAKRGAFFVRRSSWYPEKKVIEMKFTRSVNALASLKVRFWILLVASHKHTRDFGPGLSITCSGDRVLHPPPLAVSATSRTFIHPQDYVIFVLAIFILQFHALAKR